MSADEREQLRSWCRELLQKNSALRRQVGELAEANHNVRVERDAADILLAEAMDAAGGGAA
jgi:regulator of replication initiation timing